MLTRLWDFICYIITGTDRQSDGTTAAWDYDIWTRYRYSGTHRKGCGKHNRFGAGWILTRDFKPALDWLVEWKERWTKFWEEEEWTLSQI